MSDDPATPTQNTWPEPTDAVFRRLVQGITGYAIYMLDPDGVITSRNVGAVLMAGGGGEAVVGRHFGSLFEAEERAAGCPAQCLARAAQDGRHETEGWRSRPDGSRIWAHSVIEAIRDADGMLTGYGNIVRDATARHAAEEARRESEGRYRLLMESVADYAIVMLDSDGRVADWNVGAEQVKGYAREEITGRDFGCFYTPEDQRAGLPQRALATARAEGRYEAEGWRMRKDGSRFWANVVIRPLQADGLDMAASSTMSRGGFVKVTRDITVRRALEQARLQLQQARDTERFNRLVEAAPNAVVIADELGRIATVNSQAERLFGYERGELLAQSIEMLVPPRFRGTHAGQLAGFPINPGKRPIGKGRDLCALRKDGTEVPVEIGLNPIETEQGPMVVTTIVDLSHRLQIEAELRQAQKMEAVGRLTAGIAHDFNNLLQTMMGSLELLKDYVGADPRCDDLVEMSLDAAQRGARLTHHLLAFSRKQMLRPRRVDLTGLVRRMADMLRRTLGADIAIRVVGEDEALAALADPIQLEACILNLAINARDALPKGGTVTIHTSPCRVAEADATETLAAGDYALLSLEDCGTGIDPEILDKIFEPFFTTKELGKGSGLGLPMVLGFARQSGGDVRVSSVKGQGTRVDMLLPRVLPPAAIRPATADTGPGMSGGCILLVDDAPDVLVTLGAFLEGGGYDVVKAASAAEALEVVSSGRDMRAVVTDYAMPGVSGADLLRDIAQLRPNLPGLIVTGYPGIDGLGELPASVEVLNKPFPREDLLARVRMMVQGQARPGRPGGRTGWTESGPANRPRGGEDAP